MRDILVRALVLASFSSASLMGSTVTCSAGPVSNLLGTSCAIGGLTFNWTDYHNFADGTSSPEPASNVVLTFNGTRLNPSFSLGALMASSTGANSGSYGDEYVEIDYTVTVNLTGKYPYKVNELSGVFSGGNFGLSSFPSGGGYIVWGNCLGGDGNCYGAGGEQLTASETGGVLTVTDDPFSGLLSPIETFEGMTYAYLVVGGGVNSASETGGTSGFTVFEDTPESGAFVLFGIGVALLLAGSQVRLAFNRK